MFTTRRNWNDFEGVQSVACIKWKQKSDNSSSLDGDGNGGNKFIDFIGFT